MNNKELQRKRMMTYFIESADKIIQEEGILNVTIRKVSDLAGYNSATLYNYFDDLDHLLFFASMKYLKEYTLGLSAAIKDVTSQYDLYIKIWRFFSITCFKNPLIYQHLFFGNNSSNIYNSFKIYYEFFPEELGDHRDDILSILLGDTLIDRNKEFLLPLLKEMSIPEDKINLINEITNHVFHSLLMKKINNEIQLNPEELSDVMIEYIEYILLKY